MGSNTLGFSTPVFAHSEVAWSFTARFNLFENNRGGIYIMTGMENSVGSNDWAYHGKSMIMPTPVAINYNQFRTVQGGNTHQYDIALVNLAKTGNFVGPLTDNGAYQANPGAPSTISTDNNFFSDKKTSTNAATSTVWAGQGASTECMDPTAVYDAGLNKCH
jgi:hypothetical protein